MKIKITTSCSGLTFSFAEGQIVDVEKKIGDDLVRCGFAEEVKTAKSADSKRKTVKAEPEEKTEDSGDADA